MRPVPTTFFLAALALAASTGCASLTTRTPPIAEDRAAPAFTLTAQDGSDISLAELTQTGPAVLVFYRGFW